MAYESTEVMKVGVHKVTERHYFDKVTKKFSEEASMFTFEEDKDPEYI